jgi:hypothetical protein
VTDTLPAAASFVSASPGCTFAASTVRCAVGTLAAGAHATITINIKWNASGPAYDSASVGSDQINSAPAAEQFLALGTPPGISSDGPLPPWSYGLLTLSLVMIAQRRLAAAGARRRG